MIPQTLRKAWAVFIYCSFISPPPPCCFCLFRKKTCICLCTDVHTTHHSRPRESLVPCVLFVCPRLSFHMDSPMPRKAPGISISGATRAVILYSAPLFPRCPLKVSLSPSPLSSGWNHRADTKAAAEGKPGRTVHTRREVAQSHALFL